MILCYYFCYRRARSITLMCHLLTELASTFLTAVFQMKGGRPGVRGPELVVAVADHAL